MSRGCVSIDNDARSASFMIIVVLIAMPPWCRGQFSFIPTPTLDEDNSTKSTLFFEQNVSVYDMSVTKSSGDISLSSILTSVDVIITPTTKNETVVMQNSAVFIYPDVYNVSTGAFNATHFSTSTADYNATLKTVTSNMSTNNMSTSSTSTSSTSTNSDSTDSVITSNMSTSSNSANNVVTSSTSTSTANKSRTITGNPSTRHSSVRKQQFRTVTTISRGSSNASSSSYASSPPYVADAMKQCSFDVLFDGQCSAAISDTLISHVFSLENALLLESVLGNISMDDVKTVHIKCVSDADNDDQLAGTLLRSKLELRLQLQIRSNLIAATRDSLMQLVAGRRWNVTINSFEQKLDYSALSIDIDAGCRHHAFTTTAAEDVIAAPFDASRIKAAVSILICLIGGTFLVVTLSCLTYFVLRRRQKAAFNLTAITEECWADYTVEKMHRSIPIYCEPGIIFVDLDSNDIVAQSTMLTSPVTRPRIRTDYVRYAAPSKRRANSSPQILSRKFSQPVGFDNHAYILEDSSSPAALRLESVQGLPSTRIISLQDVAVCNLRNEFLQETSTVL